MVEEDHTASPEPPTAQPTCPPSPPQQSGLGQIDEVGTRSVLSSAQLLAASWVTEAHQYWGKYSLDGGQLGAAWLTHGWQSSVLRPLPSGRRTHEHGKWGGGEPTAGAKLEAPQASSHTCAQVGRRQPSECLISWHQDQH